MNQATADPYSVPLDKTQVDGRGLAGKWPLRISVESNACSLLAPFRFAPGMAGTMTAGAEAWARRRRDRNAHPCFRQPGDPKEILGRPAAAS
jgi:hypothetical protein